MERVIFGLAIGMLGFSMPAAAETLRLSNCLGFNKSISVFNGTDNVCVVPHNVVSVPACGTIVLDCEGGCKFEFDSEDSCGAHFYSGEQTVIGPQFAPGVTQTSGLRGRPEHEWRQECDCSPSDMQW